MSNDYASGECTWGVKNLASWVPNSLGDAAQWWGNYRGPKSATPVADSVVVFAPGYDRQTGLRYDSPTGHVAYVTGVNSDGTFNVTEMNFVRHGVYSTRQHVTMEFVEGFLLPPQSAQLADQQQPDQPTDAAGAVHQAISPWTQLPGIGPIAQAADAISGPVTSLADLPAHIAEAVAALFLDIFGLLGRAIGHGLGSLAVVGAENADKAVKAHYLVLLISAVVLVVLFVN